MPKFYEYLWVRLGDQDNYEEYGHDLSAVASLLKEVGIEKIWRSPVGVEAEGFTDLNRISLYWGDKIGNFYRSITKKELDQINRWLAHPEKYAFM